jgi:hypothetical protein
LGKTNETERERIFREFPDLPGNGNRLNLHRHGAGEAKRKKDEEVSGENGSCPLLLLQFSGKGAQRGGDDDGNG